MTNLFSFNLLKLEKSHKKSLVKLDEAIKVMLTIRKSLTPYKDYVMMRPYYISTQEMLLKIIDIRNNAIKNYEKKKQDLELEYEKICD